MWRVAAMAGFFALASIASSDGQGREPTVVGRVGGDDIFKVLPVGAIPAIDDPVFLRGSEADAQMSDHEPVLGVIVDGEARAYSLWQLDAHEIVNDEIRGTAIAATW